MIANIVTSVVFATMHIHLSTKTILFAFIASLCWGEIYNRQRTLIGPIVSHIIVGFWFTFILGMDVILR